MATWERVDGIECAFAEDGHEEFFDCKLDVVDEDGNIEEVQQEIGGFVGATIRTNIDFTTNNYGSELEILPGTKGGEFSECTLEGTRSGLGRRNKLRCND